MNIMGLTVYVHVNALDYNTCYSIIKIKEINRVSYSL